jgi:transcription elongation factor Elf1
MTFRTTFICRFCGVQRSSIAGSRFVRMRSGIKVRKCAECVAAEKEAGK